MGPIMTVEGTGSTGGANARHADLQRTTSMVPRETAVRLPLIRVKGRMGFCPFKFYRNRMGQLKDRRGIIWYPGPFPRNGNSHGKFYIVAFSYLFRFLWEMHLVPETSCTLGF